MASTIVKLIPLILVFIIVGVIVWVGYQVSAGAQKIRDEASERMERKNLVWSQDGLKVGVKDRENEAYVDQTQGWVVKAWKLGSAPAGQETNKSK
ncbi:hypothetical protein GMORB2_1956 [Geosmithia morbida]|uniref:Uncharacterized protein n=1 Tax=Geosmithia morbida TaxID=1094350 RepID=A0A9P5CZG7_9HYPO|nr:uncharacterized protein GMORB2_1956 [Geosmithia morbida]KAF4121548.1 hypothetical protein GMORB2_1956 [Geosmithia morbida]